MKNLLEGLGGRASVSFVARRLREEAPEFFEQLAREGVPRQEPMDAFVALFPDAFELYGSGHDRGVRRLSL